MWLTVLIDSRRSAGLNALKEVLRVFPQDGVRLSYRGSSCISSGRSPTVLKRFFVDCLRPEFECRKEVLHVFPQDRVHLKEVLCVFPQDGVRLS